MKLTISFCITWRRKDSPNDEAEKTQLLKRISMDLTALPPTVAEQDAFDKNTAANAYEQE